MPHPLVHLIIHCMYTWTDTPTVHVYGFSLTHMAANVRHSSLYSLKVLNAEAQTLH